MAGVICEEGSGKKDATASIRKKKELTRCFPVKRRNGLCAGVWSKKEAGESFYALRETDSADEDVSGLI